MDTNIVSELRRRERANAGVQAWFHAADESGMRLSVLTLGEIRKGIERLRKRDMIQAAGLENWLEELERRFSSKVLPVTDRIADQWGRLQAIRALPEIDALLAATALEHDLTLVTRNESDFKGLGITILNPFKFPIP